MPSQELIDMMQQAVAREIQVSIQYMWQHVRGAGMNSLAVTSALKEIAIEEMKHAEEIAERVYLLGGEATTRPDPITVGNDLKDFLELGVKAEREAIEMYQKILKKTSQEGDFTTRRLFMDIFKAEENHLIKFQEYLK